MKNNELNVQELNVQELITIKGGSALSDDICYYAGRIYGFCSSFGLGATKGSANRFA
jgi:hypothetical protein